MATPLRVSTSGPRTTRSVTGTVPVTPPPAPEPTPVAEPESFTTSRLMPAFRVELRRRHDDTAPIEVVTINARTLASARHAAKRERPESVILSVTRL